MAYAVINHIKKLKIHYLSDIHLEFYDITKIPRILQQIVPQSPICVLAGDIGYPFQSTYEVFLRGIHSKFEHIFLIHGNHEYYQLKNNKGKSNEEIVEKTREIIETHNLHKIHFLHNSHYDLPNSTLDPNGSEGSRESSNFRFIGSILWSKIEDKRYLSNDYELIYTNGVDQLNETHELCKNYIKNALIQAQNEDKKVIMITHHLPSFKLNHPKYAKYLNYHQCFSSHSDDLINEPVKLWIFGHTHMDINMKINDVCCVANPIGYKGEKLNPNFNRVVEVSDD
jgi:predicted phosphodiesterase